MSPPSKISSAWTWSVDHSPLLHLVRWIAHLSRWIIHRGYPNLQTNQLLAESDLPIDLRDLIHSTVRKTRLWRSERVEITQEFIAHTQDALDAGRSPDQITDSFGNPKRVAKLLRRSTKRKRPIYWRTLRNIRRTITAMIVLIIISYAGLAARFYIGKPKITENYAAAINAQNDQFSEDDKAWPIYKEVDDAWHSLYEVVNERQATYAYEQNKSIDDDDKLISPGIRMLTTIPTDHHDYEELVQLFHDFKPSLDRIRQAAHRPAIGITLGFRSGDNWKTPVEVSKHADENPPLIDLLLPYLGPVRRLSQLLYFDALLAARENNPDLAYQNLSAMLAMTRHHTTDGTLITDMVKIAILSLTMNAIEQVINECPGTLSRDHLVALAHELSLCESVLSLSFQGEIMFFEDFLQRAYTDDGNGNGRMTIEGMEMLAEQSSDRDDPFDIKKSPVRYATSPLSLTLVPDRKTEYTRYQTMMNAIKEVALAGPQYLPIIEHQENEVENHTNIIPGVRYSLVDILMPAVGKATERSFLAQMQLEATSTMLAIEIYRIDHNQLPESLQDLTPTYLPTIPEDLFDPNQPIKYTQSTTGYLIYSVGTDGDDDNGTIAERPRLAQSFSNRYIGIFDQQDKIKLNQAGVPIHDTPSGPDADWVIIHRTFIDNPNEKTKEPDQSPAPESIN